MYKIYDKWPEIATESSESNLQSIDFKNIDHIVFVGMGGSGAIGDLFASILSKTNIHVSVVKGYLLPKTVDKNTLVVAISVSGNTIETLTVLDSAKNLDCNIIGFSSGGKMGEFCGKHNINFKKIDLIHSPRTSFLKFSLSIMNVLNSILPIEKSHVFETIDELTKLRNLINSQNISDSNLALNLANFISGIPLIYYPYGLQSSAIRFKSSMQENAKTHAII